MRKIVEWFKSLFSSNSHYIPKRFLAGWYKDMVTGGWHYWHYNKDTLQLYRY